MTPPGGIPKQLNPLHSGHGEADHVPNMDAQIEEGVSALKRGDVNHAKDQFKNLAKCAEANQNIRYEILAQGLIYLSEGHILAAQRMLQGIHEHPYAQQLLKNISYYDDQVVQLQTLYLLQGLVEEEYAENPGNTQNQKLKTFLEEAAALLKDNKNSSLPMILSGLEQNPQKNYPGMIVALQALGGGSGKEILDAINLDNRLRAQKLFRIIDDKLILQNRTGTAYLIAKMYQKDPEFGQRAQQHLLQFEGLLKDPRWVLTDFMDQGATYFAISLFALAGARYASRGVWARLTRNDAVLSTWQKIWGAGLSLGVSTATYFVTEKALMTASGFDGKIWPESGSELAKEIGADMIVMGFSNLMGGIFTAGTEKFFKPMPEKMPGWLRFTRYTLRSPLRFAAWTFTSSMHGMVLYGTHRWEDDQEITQRFRQGKALHWIPQTWIKTQHDALQVREAQELLRKYSTLSSQQTQNMKGDEIYLKIRDMKLWIRKLHGNRYIQAEDEKHLLGVFWIAQACGQLNGSAKDHLLQWVEQGRYDKVNQYLYFHQIPLQISEENKAFQPYFQPPIPASPKPTH